MATSSDAPVCRFRHPMSCIMLIYSMQLSKTGLYDLHVSDDVKMAVPFAGYSYGNVVGGAFPVQ